MAAELIGDDYVLKFGPYAGHKLIKVPASYLLKLTDSDLVHYPELLAYIKRNLDELDRELAKEEAEKARNERKLRNHNDFFNSI